jgi:formate dehydrogenase/NADH-quinone oxidoreductase subunit F
MAGRDEPEADGRLEGGDENGAADGLLAARTAFAARGWTGPAGAGRFVPGVEGRAGKFPGPSLIPKLHAIQHEHGWLPREELVKLSREAKRPLYEINGIATFYPHFRTEPPSRVEITFCHDLSCWLNDGEARLGELRARYGDDAEIEIREVSCTGRCDIAPAVAVNDVPANAEATGRMVDRARDGGVPAADPLLVDEPYPNDPYAPGEERYRTLRRLLSGELDPEALIANLKDSNIRGMGGAGFPTGSKWEITRGEKVYPKYVVCNADEAEPGTFKDRQILANQSHLVLEGMLLGMLVIGAEEGWLFVRHEYGPEEHVFRAELEAAREAGLLGDDVLGSGRRLEVDVFVSPGGYILGEETALIECMEGHRGEPRNKPPFPGGFGLHGQPTLMNNVETFAHVPIITERGAEWWCDQGRGEAVGLKFFALSGHVERPGVFCAPMGTTPRELLALAGGMTDGREVLAFQPGGASANFLGPESLDVPMDWKPMMEAGSVLGTGAMAFVAEGTDMLAAGSNNLRFFRNESCGKCVPCRVGSHKALLLLDDVIAAGEGLHDIADDLEEIEEAARMTSICGLGQVALGPTMSVLRMLTEGEEGEQAKEVGPARTSHDE